MIRNSYTSRLLSVTMLCRLISTLCVHVVIKSLIICSIFVEKNVLSVYTQLHVVELLILLLFTEKLPHFLDDEGFNAQILSLYHRTKLSDVGEDLCTRIYA